MTAAVTPIERLPATRCGAPPHAPDARHRQPLRDDDVRSPAGQLVVYALQGRYEVEAVDTQRRGHATALARGGPGALRPRGGVRR